MIHIAVIIITYRRNQGLVKLLTELSRQQCLDATRLFRLTTIIVDNDREGFAAASVEPFKLINELNIRYIVEPNLGIPLARNAGIAAVPDDTEFLCFIDDDEWPSQTWIDELLKTQRATGADCVQGSVIPVHPEAAPEWLIKMDFFKGIHHVDKVLLNEGASCNVLISTAFMRRTGLLFEKRMRMTGGSDYLFFKQAVALGMRIVGSAGAIVYEDIPINRMNLRWICQRHYRCGNTFYISEQLAGRNISLFKWIWIGVAHICRGFIMLPSFLFSPYYGMRAIMNLFRGAGIIAGTCGYKYKEYSPKNLARDRSTQICR
jgi:glycosyltransferase involved in cell wall biosynthesis